MKILWPKLYRQLAFYQALRTLTVYFPQACGLMDSYQHANHEGAEFIGPFLSTAKG